MKGKIKELHNFADNFLLISFLLTIFFHLHTSTTLIHFCQHLACCLEGFSYYDYLEKTLLQAMNKDKNTYHGHLQVCFK